MLLGHFNVEAAVICAALSPWRVCASPAWGALVASVALSAELACDAFGTISPLVLMLAAPTAPRPIFDPVTAPLPIFASVTAPFAIFASVTAPFAIFASVTAPFLIFAAVTALFLICLVPTEFFTTLDAAKALPPAMTRNRARVATTFA